MWNIEAPSSAICVAIEKRNRLGLITSRRCVLGETRFSSCAKRRMAWLIVPSGFVGESQCSNGASEPPCCNPSSSRPRVAADRPPLRLAA